MASGKRVSRAGKRSGEPEQLVLFKKRGGKRRGAGRPPKGKRAGARHKQRPFLHARYPVHVVLRTVAAVGNLRRRCVYQAIREATLTTARREDFRIVQLSLQRTHVHLIVEADEQDGAGGGDAGVPDLGGQAPQCRDQQGQAGAAAAGGGVSGSLSRRDHHVADAGAAHAVVRHEQLAEARGGSCVADVGVDDRLVLQRGACSPAGPSTATRRSCGAARRRTIRSSCINREPGCFARGGSFHNAAPFRCTKCPGRGRRRDLPGVAPKAGELGSGSMGETPRSRERRRGQFARSLD